MEHQNNEHNKKRTAQNRETQRTSEKKASFCAAEEVEEEPDLERDGFAKQEEKRAEEEEKIAIAHTDTVEKFMNSVYSWWARQEKRNPKKTKGNKSRSVEWLPGRGGMRGPGNYGR